MSNTNTGGPAFPAPEAGQQHFSDPSVYLGMTLRDYFAAMDFSKYKTQHYTRRVFTHPVPDDSFNVMFETDSNGITGTTFVPVKRVCRQDDGSLTIIVDYWDSPKTDDTELLKQAMEAENDALKAELQEQARINGMGAERELALMAEAKVAYTQGQRDMREAAALKKSGLVFSTKD